MGQVISGGRSEMLSWGLAHGRDMLDNGSHLAGCCEPCLKAGIFHCQGSEG